MHNVLPDPGTLLRFQETGKTLYFEVVGSGQGTVWGSDFYTADSHLATAAVHAGALEQGEQGQRERLTSKALSSQRWVASKKTLRIPIHLFDRTPPL